MRSLFADIIVVHVLVLVKKRKESFIELEKIRKAVNSKWLLDTREDKSFLSTILLGDIVSILKRKSNLNT